MENLDSRLNISIVSAGEPSTLSNIRILIIKALMVLSAGLFALVASSQVITLDEWENSSNCYICGDEFTSTILDAYNGTDGDIVDFEDPIGDASQCITSITLTFNVAAADFNLSNDWDDVDQIDQDYPIELNGYVIGYYDPTELPYTCNVCEPNPTVTFTIDTDALPYNYGGTNTFDFNFYQEGSDNGTLQDVCVANVVVDFDTESCELTSETCPMGGYQSNDGRIFYLPGYGTDFAASGAIGLHFEEFSNGTARMHGQIERLSDSNDKFDVDLYFNNKSTYGEWTAMGMEAHTPSLGDETTWTYYSFDDSHDNTLIGQGDLSGVELYLEDTPDTYGLQIGDGANSLNSNDNGISTWFDYTGTSTGGGDINGSLLCGMPPCDIIVDSMDEEVTCGNCDGATWVFVEGGSGNYTYLLNGAEVPSYNIPYDGQIDIYDLCAGSYTLTVMDDQGCSEDYTFIIDGDCIDPPTAPNCSDDNFLWENFIDVTVLTGGAGLPQVGVRLVDGNITQFEIPGPYPAAFDGAVTVSVTEAVSWDAYLNRPNTGNQPNEQWKIVFLNDGVVQYETPYTEDLETGSQSAEWIGSLGGDFFLPNGTDQILIVHYEDDDYGSGSSSSANSVVPVSVCISYEPACDNVTDPGLIGYNQEGCAPFDPVMIESIIDPSGGTGELEYVWLVSTDGGNNSDVIPGAEGSTYNPGILTEDTWFRRCARRAGCDEYVGESNWIFIEITGNCPDGPCEESLVSYGGDCEDGPDSFIPISSESCLSNISDLVPIGGNSSASCDDEIICVASWNNPGWVFSFEANEGITVEGIRADLLYPIELSTAGGSSNHDDCATNFDYHVEFYKNGSLVESIEGNIPADIIVSENINLSDVLFLAAGDELEVKIIGDPTSSDCDLFENAGTEVIGCCGGDPCEGVEITAVRIYDQVTDAPAVGIDPIVDGSVINLSDLPANYYLAIEVTDQTESVIIQVNGVNQSIENVIPYTFPNGNENWNAGLGEYTVHAEAYAQDGAMGDLCDEIDLTFIITEDCEIECPDDLILDCTSSVDPEYTGYPTLICGGDSECARDYGDFDFIFEGFAGDVDNWSFGQGWDTGDGCDPQCGSYPNAFIDFGEFYSDYDRSLTSEVFDGCCTDVVYISYCLRHDLYASGNPPTGYLDVEVSVDGGEWVSFQQYETQNGSTIDWTENNISVPGAPNSSFQIRFRATGEGYDYTLGGWGIDNVHITGWTNGCDPMPIEVDVDWNYEDSSAGTCPEVITRTWSGEYDGEIISCVQTITLEDNDAPDFSQVPADLTIECGTTAEVVWPLINDACDDNPDLTYNDEVNGGGCEYSIDRVFTATDNCGNTSSYTQVISVLDTEDPVFDNDLEDLTVECGGELPPAPECSATDNCDDDLTYEFNEYYPGFNNLLNCQSSDADHHSLWISQAGVLDASDSDWNAVGPGSFEQFADGTAILTGTVANEDDSDQIFNYELHLHLERTYAEWTSIPNGNSPTGFREAKLDAGTSVEINDEYLDWSYYEVNDAENNMLTGAGDYAGISMEIHARPADYQFGVQVGERASLQSIGFGLSCWIDLVGTINGEEEELHGDFNLAIAPCEPGETPEFDCADTYVVERVWTATDDCGNTAVQTQTITVTGDTEDPVLVGVPADETVECDNVPDPADVTATDNCDDDVDVDFNEDITPLECGYTITRTWTATDDCEHSVSATQVITVTDTTDPELFGVPADITIECDEEAPDAIVFATDNCDDDLTVSLTSTTTPQDCGWIMTRTWSTVDDCGNDVSESQIVTVLDTTDPTFDNLPGDQTGLCDQEILPADVTASDNCDDDVDVTVEQSTNGTGCDYTITFTYTATDDCGNDIVGSYSVTVLDNTPPVADNDPADIIVECDDIPAPPVVNWTDNCDPNVNTDYFEVNEVVDACLTLRTRIWIGTDNCGNTAQVNQVVSIIDSTSPVLFGVPADITIECDEEAPDAIVFATDNCDDDLIVSLTSTTTPQDCGWIMTRTWSTADDCGNPVSQSQIVTVLDTTDPFVVTGVDPEVTIECDEDEPTDAPTFDDNCDDDLDITAISGITNVTDCGYDIERAWTATDDCNNSVTVTQIVHVVDTTDPTFDNIPEDQTGLCDQDILPADVTASDNCDDDVEVTVEETQDGDGCDYTITFTYTATDDCGNTAVDSYSVTVLDNTPPVADNDPNDIIVECDAISAPPVVNWTDNCDDNVTTNFFEIDEVIDACTTLRTRVWIGTDHCGNTAQVNQVVTIIDSTSPILFGVPADITIECDEEAPDAIVFATDNCDDDLTVSLTSTTTPMDCGWIMTRTWSTADDCGNPVSESQTVTVLDTTDPYVVTGVDPEVTIECDEDEPTDAPTFDDNCDDDLDITAISGITNVSDCGYDIERSWTATDDCDNSVTVSQTIHVLDTTSPELSDMPADMEVDCSEIPDAAVLTATDNCDDDVMVDFNEVIGEGCPYTISRTWSAADDCGNPVSYTQVITVTDTTDPILAGVPEDYDSDCGDAPQAPVVTASDDCDDDVPVIYSEVVTGDECPLTIVRTWTATDDCGNSTSASQTITIDDEIDPVLVGVPADETVECDSVPAPADVTAIDNCDADPDVSYSQDSIPGDPVMDGAPPCGWTLIRTWTATDLCGNSVEASQTITVVDTTAPDLIGVPADETVECDNIPAPPVVTAVDNCWDEEMEVVLEENTIPLECGYQLVRTWIAEDNCWNYASETQVITVVDTTDPELFGVPADVTIECDEDVPNAIVFATDNCDDDLTVSVSSQTIPQDCGHLLIRTWSTEDDCGNDVSESQTVTVLDTTDPFVVTGVDPEVTIECDEDEPTDAPTFDDNCDDDLEITAISGITNVSDCGYDIERSWTATDDCDNSITVSQTIHVLDTQAPVLSLLPGNMEVDCSEIPDAAVITATDNCDDDVTVDFNEVIGEGCPYTITRTWSAADDCGNPVSHTQVITVTDTTDPVLAGVPEDYDSDCGDAPEVPVVTASDDCDTDVPVIYSEVVTGDECPLTIVRTWTATDDCGNSTSASQTITIDDEIDPVLVGVPADETVECDSVPAPADVTATDNCDLDPDLDFDESIDEGDCEGEYVITRTWTATDLCGNMAEATQTITVVDTTDPILSGVPADDTVECDDIPDPAIVTASDNCTTTDIIVTLLEETIDADCGYTLIRYWTAHDACGNTTTESQVLTVVDTTDPVLNGVPATDTTVECDEDTTAPIVTATDNCTPNLEVDFDEVINDLECGYEIVRTWYAEDECGNDVSATRTITVVDTTSPTLFGVPADIEISCGDDVPDAIVGAMDNCDDDLVVSLTSNTELNDCGYVLTRTWSTQDDCGNPVSATQVVTAVDNEDPYVVSGPQNVTVDCEYTGELIPPVFDDECDDELTIDFDSSEEGDACEYVITNTWTATDDCGHSVDYVQTITIVDTEDPVITCPADADVSCEDGGTSPADTGVATATDNCGTPTVTFEDSDISGNCPATFERVWTATDACGNTSSCTQLISVSDDEDPVWDEFEVFVSAECDDVDDYAPTAMDNCTVDVTVTLISELFFSGGCAGTIERTYEAVDGCGNSIQALQLIMLTDETPPVLSGQDETIESECHLPVLLAAPTVSDNCDDEVDVDYDMTSEPGDCENSWTEIHTWTATDDCENVATRVITVVYDDTTDPEFGDLPQDTTAECDNIPPMAEVSATDNCDLDVDIDTDETTNVIDDCFYEIVRTWTATDNCGNDVSHTQTITVSDNTDPIVVTSVDPEVTIECDEDEPTDVPTFDDNCDDDLELIAISGINNVSDCGYDIEKTWTAIDDCGNSVSVSQVIHVQDTTDPVLSETPADVEVSCDNIPLPADVTATDNCDDDVQVGFTEVFGEGCPYTITRTWTAADDCGNDVSHTQVITVIDNEDPVLVGVPDDITEECGDAPDPNDVTATDNCDNDVDVQFSEVVTGDSCPLTITRTWTATDNCGNTSSDSQTIIIDDETDPVFTSVPADETVECDNVPGPGDVTVTDNCDSDPDVSFDEEIIPGDPAMEGGPPCGWTVIRTWTATDLCGNDATAEQVITVVDTTAPDLVGVPADVTVECTDIPDAPIVTAVDNCWDGEMIVTLEENTIDLDCGYQLIRTWTAEDNCWNYNSETQVITVTDTTDPEVESTPADVTIECTDDLPTDDATFSDNCDDELDVIENDVTVDQDCGYYILRTWTATDDCGNSISTTQTINVTDTTDPVLSGVPADMEVECSDIPDPADVTATDNCDDDVQVVYNQEIVEGNCPYEIIRTWTATDNCGNTVSESQTLTVNDTTDPTLVGVPDDVTVDCNNIPDPADVTADDNCGVDLTVNLTEDFIQNDCGYTIVRVWTVHDPCGNTGSDSQLIVVVDTEDPVASNEPANASYECDEIIPLDEPTFSDDCDDDLSVGFNESSTGDACTQTITRTWTAMDDCGNTAVVTQVITVTDTTDPVLVGVPADTTIECNTEVPGADVTATDNCDTAPTVDMDEQTNDLDCGYEIVRTWTATDDCGNNVSATQTITVTDTTDPVVLGTPVDTTVECDEVLPTDEPLFDDNCDLDLDVDLDEQINTLDCEYEIVRTWTATDDCGNSVSTSQTITVTDTTDPVLVGLPADETVECDNIPLPADVTATDNCDDDLTVDFNEMIFMTGCPYTIERTWTVEDDCGNSASYTQTLTVTDTTDPTLIGVPADDTVECDNVPDAAVVTVDDNCDLNIQVQFNESSQDADCGYVITRTWSATDACGNTASESQVLTVVDTTDPVLSGVPADTTAECDDVPAAATVTASDNCDDDLVVDFDEDIDPQDCGYIITRTWSTEDDCGNTASSSQVITVIDTTDPVITDYPADVTVQCDNVPGPGQISANDNCDTNLDIDFDDVVDGPDCNYTIERTWTATDDCGNSTSVTQTITVIDTTDPEISGVPADETIECGGDIPAAADITATDNCDPAPVTGVSEQTIPADCGYTIERTYTATDACGNTAEIVQTITVIDTTDPIILNPPADETVNCDAVTIAPTLTASDNCDDDVDVTLEEVIGEGCPYTITRTWTATDDCGNTSSVTQVVTVIDDEDPEWDPFEGFVQVSCDEVDDYILTASDNCDVDVTVTITQELLFSGGCLGTIERTYEAVDNCGNAIIAVQLIQVIDDEAPVLVGVPADVEIDCDGEVPPVADVTATDNCDDDVEVIFSEVITDTFCPFEIIRTWTAIDHCGNVTEEIQVISVTVETPDLVSLVSFPNPFNDVFTVEFSVPKGAVVNACIYNLIGQEVHMLHKGTVDAHRLYAYTISGADWESGTYVIMMQVDDEVYHHKMMVMDK